MIMKDYLNNVVFVIPCLNPDERMEKYVKDLIKNGVKHILLVNDGSSKETTHHFEELDELDEVTIVTHQVNQGKGREI